MVLTRALVERAQEFFRRGSGARIVVADSWLHSKSDLRELTEALKRAYRQTYGPRRRAEISHHRDSAVGQWEIVVV